MSQPSHPAEVGLVAPHGFEANLTELLRIAERQHLDCHSRIASVDQKLVITLDAQATVLLKGAEQSWRWHDPYPVAFFLAIGLLNFGIAGRAYMAKKWRETPELKRFRSVHAGKSELGFNDQLLANYAECVSENTTRLGRKVRWLNLSLITLFVTILILSVEMYQERGTRDEAKRSSSQQRQ